jgi:hypothetical protein
MDSYDIHKIETLKVIRYLESNNGKYTNHKSSAKGDYGLMPKSLEDAKKSFNYSKIKLDCDHSKARLYYDFIVKTIGTNDPAHVAYSWLNGPYKIPKIPLRRKNVLDHWYVKRFMKRAKVSSLNRHTLFDFPSYMVKSQIVRL